MLKKSGTWYGNMILITFDQYFAQAIEMITFTKDIQVRVACMRFS
jgi:hypothetical protein